MIEFMNVLPLIVALWVLLYLLSVTINLLDRKWRFGIGEGVVIVGKNIIYGAIIIDRKRFLLPSCQKAYLLRAKSNSIPDHWVTEVYLLTNTPNVVE